MSSSSTASFPAHAQKGTDYVLHVLALRAWGFPPRPHKLRPYVKIAVGGRKAKTETGTALPEVDWGEGQRVSVAVSRDSIELGDKIDIVVAAHGVLGVSRSTLGAACIPLSDVKLLPADTTNPCPPITNIRLFSKDGSVIPGCTLQVRMILLAPGHTLIHDSPAAFWVKALPTNEIHEASAEPPGASRKFSDVTEDAPVGLSFGPGIDTKPPPLPATISLPAVTLASESRDFRPTTLNNTLSPSTPEDSKNLLSNESPLPSPTLDNVASIGDISGTDVKSPEKEKRRSLGSKISNILQPPSSKPSSSHIRHVSSDGSVSSSWKQICSTPVLTADGVNVTGWRLHFKVLRGHNMKAENVILPFALSVLRPFVRLVMGKTTVDSALAQTGLPNPQWTDDGMEVESAFNVVCTGQDLEIRVFLSNPSNVGPKRFIGGVRVPVSSIRRMRLEETADDIPEEWLQLGSIRPAKGTGEDDVSLYSDETVPNTAQGSLCVRMCMVSPEHSLYQTNTNFWMRSACRGPRQAATWRLHVRIIRGIRLEEAEGLEAVKTYHKKNFRPLMEVRVGSVTEVTDFGWRIPDTVWAEGTADLVFDLNALAPDTAVQFITQFTNPTNTFAPCISTLGSAIVLLGKIQKLEIRESAENVESTLIQLTHKGKRTGQIEVRMALVPPQHQLSRGLEFWNSTQKGMLAPMGKLRIGVRKARVSSVAGADEDMKAYCLLEYESIYRRSSVSSSQGGHLTWERDSFDFPLYELTTDFTVYVFHEENARFIGAYTCQVCTLHRQNLYRSWVPLMRKSSKRMYKKGGDILLEVFLDTTPEAVLPRYIKEIQTKSQIPSKSALERELVRQGIDRRVLRYLIRDPSKEFAPKIVKSHFWRINSCFSWLSHFSAVYDYICEWRSTEYSLVINLLWCNVCLRPHTVLPAILISLSTYSLWYKDADRTVEPRLPVRLLPQILQDIQDEDSDEEEEDVMEYPSADNELASTQSLGSMDSKRDSKDASAAEKKKKAKKAPNPVAGLQQTIASLKGILLRVQGIMGAVADKCESVTAVLAWSDPRMTFLFTAGMLLLAFILLTVLPTRYFMTILGLIVFRHPVLRSPGSIPGNIFSRLPNHRREMRLML